jgi:hypothetical protein
MNICVAGWHYGPCVPILKRHGAYVVGHRANELADVVIPNVGLEFGCYDYYLNNVWNGGDTLYIHDDNEIDESAFASIASINRDQVFIFSDKDEARLNGYAHGRALFCSDKLQRKLLIDGGFWYDEGNVGNASPTTNAPDYHNNAIQIFRNYLATLEHQLNVGAALVISGLKCGYRGRLTDGTVKEECR